MVLGAAVGQKAYKMIRVDPSFRITGSISLQDHGERRSRSESLGDFGCEGQLYFPSMRITDSCQTWTCSKRLTKQKVPCGRRIHLMSDEYSADRSIRYIAGP